MNSADLYGVHYGGVIRTRDMKAYAISHGLLWSSVLVSISRWQKQGLLERVTRGAYLVRDVDVNAPVAACLLVPDSYISLESAMVYHGMLLDRIYRIDLACVRRVKGFHIRETEIKVSKIPPRLYWGWEIEESAHGPIRVASPEKALFDRIYMDRTAIPDYTYFEDMGLQPDALNADRFAELAACSPKVNRFSRYLKEYSHA
jgi:predicted transcriptional regulator of viral defense system